MIISNFNKKTILVLSFILLLFVVFGLSSFWQLRHLQQVTNNKISDINPQFEITTSKKEKVDVGFYSFGMMEGGKVEETTANITSKILQTYLSDGDYVKKNQKILTLERRDIDISLTAAQKTFDKERLNFEAISKLYDQKLVSKKELNQAMQNYQSAEQNLNKIALTNKFYDVVAPFDGYLAKIYSKKDEVAFAGQTKLAKFVSNNDIYLFSSLSDDKKRLISLNMSVDILLNDNISLQNDDAILPNMQSVVMPAKITAIYPSINKISKTFEVRLLVDKSNEYYSKFHDYIVEYPLSTLKLFFKTAQKDAFFAPLSAITYRENNSIGIYILDESSEIKFIEVDIVKTLINGLFIAPKDISLKFKKGKALHQKQQLPQFLKILSSGGLYKEDGNLSKYSDI